MGKTLVASGWYMSCPTNRPPQHWPARCLVVASAFVRRTVSAWPVPRAGGDVDRVTPLPKSTLATQVPSAVPAALLQALPKPADFGSGRTFDTNSLGSDDFVEDVLRGDYPSACVWADPAKAGIEVRSATQVVSGGFIGPSNAESSVSIALDSPATTAARFAYLHRIADKCHSIQVQREGHKATKTVTLTAGPPTGGDESILFASHTDDSFFVDLQTTCSRAGGLAVCITWFTGDNHPSDSAVVAVFDRARQALHQ